ncbi:MAG: hypothetical protein ACQEQC_07535 [Elusimicrobiota bacterium]
MRNFKITVTVFLFLIMAFPKNSGAVFNTLSSLKKDKYVHFSAGVLVSHGSYPFFKKHVSKDDAWMYSMLLSITAGLGKEIYDIPRTGFNWADLAATSIGGSTIIVVQF